MKKLFLLLWIFGFCREINAQNAVFPPGFAAVQVATGLDPVAFTLAPDGRIFIAEKTGRVLIVENGVLRSEPFLEVDVDSYTERGMCGIALDPDFGSNHFVYVYYTVKNEGHNRVSRFTADGNFVTPGSELVLLDLDQLSGPYHNAGALAFGIDGKLYIDTGDGFNKDNAQSLNSVLGKILRINPDGSIPTDNPFYNETSGKNRAIYAMGFRNPFAMTVDPLTGRMFATDVGSDQFEEVNEIEAGKNYGWPLVEGKLTGSPPQNYHDPLTAYDHNFGCAAVGVTMYNPFVPMFPNEYLGKIFFSELCKNKIFTLDPTTGDIEVFASNLSTPLNLLTAPDGTFYFIDRSGTQTNYATNVGSLWRVFYTGSNAPFVSVQPQPVLVPVSESVQFRVAASGEAPLSFQWQQDGVDIAQANNDTLIFQNPMLSDSGSLLRCIVTNASGSDTSQAAMLRVTSSHRPSVEMISPAEGDFFRGGEWMHLNGVATDAEEGPLGPSRFRWRVDLHHNVHSHPAFGPITGTDDEYFPIPSVNEVSDFIWYKVHLTVTDLSGLSSNIERVVLPIKSKLVVQTSPQGFPIVVDGHRRTTPDTVTVVSGIFHQIDAPKSHVTPDSIYLFEKWASGETSTTLLLAPGDNGLNLKAIYKGANRAGTGDGLLGSYFKRVSGTPDFGTPVLMTRIDSMINFNWNYGSPDSANLSLDRFLIRWEGFIQPFFDEKINFHVFMHTDWARLWVDNQLLIDRWFTSSDVEASASVDLKSGEYYPIKLEYGEVDGLATCELLWSSEKIEREFVPKSQLYSAIIVDTNYYGPYKMLVNPNPVKDILLVEVYSEDATVLDLTLYNMSGQLVLKKSVPILPGHTTTEINCRDFAAGQYILKVKSGFNDETIPIIKI